MTSEIYEILEQAYKQASEPLQASYQTRVPIVEQACEVGDVLPDSRWKTSNPDGSINVATYIDPEPYYIAFQFALIKNSTRELSALLSKKVEIHPAFLPVLSLILENSKLSVKGTRGIHQTFILTQKRLIHNLVVKELIQTKTTHAKAFEKVGHKYGISTSEISDIWNEITKEIIKKTGKNPFPKRKTRPSTKKV